MKVNLKRPLISKRGYPVTLVHDAMHTHTGRHYVFMERTPCDDHLITVHENDIDKEVFNLEPTDGIGWIAISRVSLTEGRIIRACAGVYQTKHEAEVAFGDPTNIQLVQVKLD